MKCKKCGKEYFGLTLAMINPETEICVDCELEIIDKQHNKLEGWKK